MMNRIFAALLILILSMTAIAVVDGTNITLRGYSSDGSIRARAANAGSPGSSSSTTSSSSSSPEPLYASKAACSPNSPPSWTDGWVDANNSTDCDYTISGITFNSVGQITGHSTAGRLNPNNVSDIENCVLGNALWWGNHVHGSPENSDLSNPQGEGSGAIRYWFIKNSLHEGTTHFTGPPSGHEDLIQPYRNLPNGGLVIQDSVFTNADENAFVDIGNGEDGYGNGPGGDFACYTDGGEDIPFGTRHVVLQGLKVGPPVPGATNLRGERYDDKDDGSGAKSYQMFFGNPSGTLDEIWMINMEYDNFGIGMRWYDSVGKVIVVETNGGGHGGQNGWPGPLKSTYGWNTSTHLTSGLCGGTWDPNYHGTGQGACIGPGLINDTNADGTADVVFPWNGSAGDDPESRGVVPVYFYTSIEQATGDGHSEPPFVRASCTGWQSPPQNCDSSGYQQ